MKEDKNRRARSGREYIVSFQGMGAVGQIGDGSEPSSGGGALPWPALDVTLIPVDAMAVRVQGLQFCRTVSAVGEGEAIRTPGGRGMRQRASPISGWNRSVAPALPVLEFPGCQCGLGLCVPCRSAWASHCSKTLIPPTVPLLQLRLRVSGPEVERFGASTRGAVRLPSNSIVGRILCHGYRQARAAVRSRWLRRRRFAGAVCCGPSVRKLDGTSAADDRGRGIADSITGHAARSQFALNDGLHAQAKLTAGFRLAATNGRDRNGGGKFRTAGTRYSGSVAGSGARSPTG